MSRFITEEEFDRCIDLIDRYAMGREKVKVGDLVYRILAEFCPDIDVETLHRITDLSLLIGAHAYAADLCAGERGTTLMKTILAEKFGVVAVVMPIKVFRAIEALLPRLDDGRKETLQ